VKKTTQKFATPHRVLISPRRFAQEVGLSYWLALKMVKRGDIPSIACGQRRRINSFWVARWLAGSEGGGKKKLTS